MSSPPEPAPDAAEPRAIADVTCTACGCLCDDLTLTVAGGKLVEAERACDPGRRWFLADHSHAGVPEATIEGRAVATAEALDRAAEILHLARSPVVLGLTRTTTETVAAALAVADRIGAVVDPSSSRAANPGIVAVQRLGRVSATLGEVKNRADVVVFWGVDPIVTHPRHWERYSVEPRGRFVPRGRAGRTVIVADAAPTATADRADRFVRVAADAQLEVLWALRALVRGVGLDPGRVERSTRLDWTILVELVERLKSARYGAWFVGPALGLASGGSAWVEAALALVRDLNAFTRFVILSLGSPGNPSGAEAALTWQTGFPSSVSLARGSPESLPGVTSACALLERGEADAALIVSETGIGGLSGAARAHLGRIPRIVIAPRATASGDVATVALDSATYGIDAPGTVMRSDGVVLPLRPPLDASVPTDRELLRGIDDRLKSLQVEG